MKAFTIDLTQFIKESLQQGYTIIVCLDVNKNMQVSRIVKIFSVIDLIETTKLFYSGHVPAIFLEGQHQIDGV